MDSFPGALCRLIKCVVSFNQQRGGLKMIYLPVRWNPMVIHYNILASLQYPSKFICHCTDPAQLKSSPPQIPCCTRANECGSRKTHRRTVFPLNSPLCFQSRCFSPKSQSSPLWLFKSFSLLFLLLYLFHPHFQMNVLKILQMLQWTISSLLWGRVALTSEKAMAPTPVLLPGKSHGWRSCWAAVYGVAQSRTWLTGHADNAAAAALTYIHYHV